MSATGLHELMRPNATSTPSGNEPTSVRSANEPENRCTYVVADTTAQAAEFLAVGQAES